MKKRIMSALAARNMKKILMGAVAVLFLAGTSVAAMAANPNAKPRTHKQENKDQKKPEDKTSKTGPRTKRVTKTNKTMKNGSTSTSTKNSKPQSK